MVRGTTPTLTLKIRSDTVNLYRASDIFVSIEQTGVKIELGRADINVVDSDTIECFLTQEQSLKLSSMNAPAKIQVNWIFEDDGGRRQRLATKLKTIDIESQLLGREI